MKKIPNLFERDWNGDKSRVLPELHRGADVEWVLRGEGTPTIKWDGSACMIRNGALYVRYDAKRGKMPPLGFEPCQEEDAVTGHRPGWIPADGPASQWHRDAYKNSAGGVTLSDGTYEALGPQHQSNPYKLPHNILRKHGVDKIAFYTLVYASAVDAFQFLRDWLSRRRIMLDEMPEEMPIEGIVWHHPDGRMVKVLASDLGLPWKVKARG